jgi:hypothetical protein
MSRGSSTLVAGEPSPRVEVLLAMDGATRYEIGAAVVCADGDCGHLRRVVIDPIARSVTHLVIEPTRWSGPPRLTPIALVVSTAEKIRLACSRADFDALEEAEETHFMTSPGDSLGYGRDELYAWPHYRLGLSMTADPSVTPPTIVEDRLPPGEVDVRRGEQVHATDGEIGRLHGLIIDASDHHVTHVLLEEGHLWGKKTVAIPIGAVRDVDAGVHLTLTRAQIKELPPVEHDSAFESAG